MDTVQILQNVDMTKYYNFIASDFLLLGKTLKQVINDELLFQEMKFLFNITLCKKIPFVYVFTIFPMVYFLEYLSATHSTDITFIHYQIMALTKIVEFK